MCGGGLGFGVVAGAFPCAGVERGVLLLGLFLPRNRTENGRTPVPTITADALKRMLHLPANVVTGTPRVEKDPHGGDVAVVPVRPYAGDMGRCARLFWFNCFLWFWSGSFFGFGRGAC